MQSSGTVYGNVSRGGKGHWKIVGAVQVEWSADGEPRNRFERKSRQAFVQQRAMKSARREFDSATLVQPPCPILAGPRPPEKPLPLPKLLRAMKDNPLSAIPRIAYDQLIWDAKWLFGHQLLVSDPAGIKRVLLDNAANYPKAALPVHILSKAFGEGIHVSDGEKWRTHRRIMSPSFDLRSIASCAPAIVEAAQARLRAWDLLGDAGTIDIATEMRVVTREVISRSVFSADASTLGTEFDRALREGFEHLNFSPFDMAPVIGPILLKHKLKRVRSEFEALYDAIERVVEARGGRTVEQSGDLLDRLVTATDGATGRMTGEEIRDELIAIFLGGHETSTLAATYVWYLLSQHAFAEEMLHAELASVLGGRAPTFADLPNLPYTRMVIEESMRLYPPGPVLSLRVAREADAICGRPVPRGTEIAVVPWVVHRHRMLWENPDVFDPDRFSPERSAGRPRFAYLPFGGGHRICIGAALAMTEISLLLATMAQRYRLRLVPGRDIVLQYRLTLRPRDGIRMFLERRVGPATL